MIWNEKYETMKSADMKKHQSDKLVNLVNKVYDKVPFYREKMDTLGIKPSDIKSISDIVKLPFTSKDDMREVYPYGLLACDKKDIVEIHTSSGTTGKPVVDAYTSNDVEIWSEVMARTFAMGGANEEDVVQIAYGYGLFTGGLGAHYGAKKLGAMVIPISAGNSKRQLSIMRDFGTTILACTPSYSLYIAEIAAEEKIEIKGLKAGFFGAEPWSESMRKEIEEKLKIKAYDIYGLTEIIGPGVASECECQDMLHINEDHFYPEIINPETGKVLPDGEKGELVFTTLTKEGTPIIRYRTRDITYLDRSPCKCGRTTVRMHRLLGRTDDMLIIRGVNVFPSQIEEVLLKLENIEPHYQLLVSRKDKMDFIEVQIEMNEKLFSDEMKNLSQTEKMIEQELYKTLNIHTKVKLVEPKSIPRSEGKAKRIIDQRQI
ncbi:MAG TPA: phenylacetate--CoA ligase [Spirochaetota bacterium]|nr:phenylacetate--CoA ligase [Spirochaetota bacterium]HOS33309.1 phenylacetate--CoA ligase [Spirochaetota bacterium]HOS55767.1 phenylacetate--CoA ligase [Spirochaetota bacterium]HPK61159.1 phenylacetate--CoA ligase [Spirochaetota bacterium]HQF76721.1 phenylacetate--CoA ligase [Spirochaetota bacterium]